MEKELRQDEKNKICIDTFYNSYKVYELDGGDWRLLKEFKNYDDAEEYLNKRLDRKAKGTLIKKTPIQAILKKWNENYKKTKITSIEVSTGDYIYCWNSDEDKNRSKEGLSSFLKDTDRNWEIIREIKSKKEEIDKLEEEKERFSKEELKEYFQDE